MTGATSLLLAYSVGGEHQFVKTTERLTNFLKYRGLTGADSLHEYGEPEVVVEILNGGFWLAEGERYE